MQHVVEWAAVNSFTRSRARGGRTAIFFLFRAATGKKLFLLSPAVAGSCVVVAFPPTEGWNRETKLGWGTQEEEGGCLRAMRASLSPTIKDPFLRKKVGWRSGGFWQDC